MKQRIDPGGAVRQRPRRGTSIFKNRYLYLMLVPGIAYFVIFRYLPMAGIVIAFKEYSVFKGVWGSPWVGFQNFAEIFHLRDFWMVLRNTLLISIYKTVFGFPAPVILALMLNYPGSQGFKRTVQTILYLPHFVSWVVVSGILLSILSPSFGIAGEIFRWLGLQPVNLLAVPRLFRGILVLSDIWKSSGFGTIIYLATLSTIDPNLYEASDIDGARRLQQVWHISLPSIRPVVVLLLILQLGYILDAGFEQILVMQNAIVQSVSEVFDTYVYHVGLQQGRYSLTTAIGLFKSVVAAILIVGSDRFAKSIGESGLL